jgi:hypothetical protein
MVVCVVLFRISGVPGDPGQVFEQHRVYHQNSCSPVYHGSAVVQGLSMHVDSSATRLQDKE